MQNEKPNYEQLNLLWLRAAILGSIWASSEIILGSFLHNLRIPFSGTFLSAIGVYLLAAFDVKWRQPGLIWRAGVICALLKSISPSAVIFGPMIAIVVEAFLFAGAVSLFGRNIFGYGVGGAIAVTWSLIHKLSNMIIFYGADILQIYANFYKYAAKVTSLNLGSPVNLIVILFIVYLFVGFIVAIFGMLAGRKAIPLSLDYIQLDADSLFTRKAQYTNQNIVWLFIEIIILTVGLFILSNYNLITGFSFVIVATAINLFKYKKFLSKRFKVKFWIELALVTTLAGFFMGGIKESGWEFSFNNLSIGFQITLRALLLTECFSLIGVELANQSIKNMFLKFGFKQLQTALEAAFQALPLMLAILSSHKDKLRTPSVLISGFITFADTWISEIDKQYQVESKS